MDKSTHIPFGKEYTATPITVAEMVKQVQDRKTGEFYDPQEKFDELMNRPEIMDVMNERIKELLEQAGVGDNWNAADWYSMSPKMLEKFAELIVKETLQVARAGFEYGPSMEEVVYKYFGVEE